MSKPGQASVLLGVLGIGIALTQVVDILIHAATHQLELLRVTSNLIVLVWLAGIAIGKFNAKLRQIAASAIGVYLALNLIFLAVAGIRNVEQGGQLRITLFILVFLTITLSIALAYQLDRRRSWLI